MKLNLNIRNMKLILFLSAFLLAFQIQAETEKSNSAPAFSAGLISGPYLPSKVPGVEEILKVVGLRIGTNTNLGSFESEGWIANGYGVHFNSVAFNYRLNIINDYLPVHALVGLHIDSYTKPDSTSASGGGWQMGGGAEAKLFGPLLVRSDFEYRIGPGNSLLVLVSLMLGF